MVQLILQPAADRTAHGNYKKTVDGYPVSLDSISPFISSTDLARLQKIYPSGQCAVWGAQDNNYSKWERLKEGDIVIFTGNNVGYASAQVSFKTQNESLARFLWGHSDSPFQYVYFLSNVESHHIPVPEINKQLGYKENYAIRSLTVLSKDRSKPLLDNLLSLSSKFKGAPTWGGGAWTEGELELIVSDYIEMLQAEINKEPYNKTEHRKRLVLKVARVESAIEFKHRNISAAIEDIGGYPIISGYKALPNYQTELLDVVSKHLAKVKLPETYTPPKAEANLDVFVPIPDPRPPSETPPPNLPRVARKFNAAEKDERNRNLGRAGESFVFELEKSRLLKAGRSDLAENVRWVSDQDGDGLGYDIRSYDEKGQELWIEVKTTNGAIRTPFLVSSNEFDVASEAPDLYRIYRVFSFNQKPQIFVLQYPFEVNVNLTPATYRFKIK